jgi:branched-chain amino acid aminotransferase
MYSSLFGGVVTDATAMVVPVDDHMVHRGDAIFEAFECVNGALYNLNAHLSRLERSARLISLQLPFDLDTIKDIIVKTVAIAGARECSLRTFVSRGLGGFGCKPTQCVKTNLYVVVFREPKFPQRYYTEGASAITSCVPIKPSFLARVKSCNYLLNALYHLEAYQSKADFAVVLDQQGNLAEGATESIAIVTEENVLAYPKPEHILDSTTLGRELLMARELVDNNSLSGITCRDIPQEEIFASSELLIFSTILDVAPIVTYDGKTIGDGKPGPVFHQLFELIQKDKTENQEVLTPVPYP